MSGIGSNWGFAQDQSIHYLELEGMLVKEKVELLEQSLREEKAKRASLEHQHKLELE